MHVLVVLLVLFFFLMLFVLLQLVVLLVLVIMLVLVILLVLVVLLVLGFVLVIMTFSTSIPFLLNESACPMLALGSFGSLACVLILSPSFPLPFDTCCCLLSNREILL